MPPFSPRIVPKRHNKWYSWVQMNSIQEKLWNKTTVPLNTFSFHTAESPLPEYKTLKGGLILG